MLNVISTILPSLEKFLGEFKDFFIEPQFKNFKVYPFGLELRTKEKHRTKKRRREFTVEKLVNSLLPSSFQVITKVYKDGKEEKQDISGQQILEFSLLEVPRGSLS